jgi:hypothetical protein
MRGCIGDGKVLGTGQHEQEIPEGPGAYVDRTTGLATNLGRLWEGNMNSRADQVVPGYYTLYRRLKSSIKEPGAVPAQQ